MGRPQISEETIQKAQKLIESGYSIRRAAKEVGVGDATLRRRIKPKGSSMAKTEPKGKVRNLRFIRVFDFKLIPRQLFEQIKGIEWNIDRLYNYGQTVGTNPCTMLYCLVDEEFKIKGFMWASLNPLKETILVNTLSVDKEYQNHGEPLEYAYEFLMDIVSKLDLKGIEWTTTRPRVFQKILGAKYSKQTLMII